MIVVDSSVWIDFFNGTLTPQVLALKTLSNRKMVVVGDLVMCEVLRGERTDRNARRAERTLRRFRVEPMLSPRLAVLAAANYRRLLAKGRTVAIVDLIIGTYCIASRYSLLHSDGDFRDMQEHIGLQVIDVAAGVREEAAPYDLALVA